MNSLKELKKKNDKVFDRKHGLIWFAVFNILDTCVYFLCEYLALPRESIYEYLSSWSDFEEITYLSSLFMAFSSSVLVFPCCRSKLSSW